MTRAHLYRPLQDAAGNLQRGATVRLFQPGTATLFVDPIFVADSGDDVYQQPISCPDGFLNVYFARPKRVRIGVTPFGGGTEVFFDDIDVPVLIEDAALTPIREIPGMVALNVQAALEELQERKYDTEQGQLDLTAQQVAFVPAEGGLLGGANVQVVLEEVDGHLVAADGRLDGHDATLTSYDGRLDTVEDGLGDLELRVIAQEEIDAATRLTALENEPDPVGNTFKSTSGAGLPDPLTRTLGDLHFDETANQEYVLAGDPAAWVSTDTYIAPHVHSQVQAFATRTANRTLTATDGVEFFTGTNLTATLPTPVGRAGVQFTIKNLDPSTLTVATAAGLIDATATRVLAQYDSLTVISDGTNWGVI